MEQYNNRENYRLLEFSEKSDSEPDLNNFINIPKKKRLKRKMKKPIKNSESSTYSSYNVWFITLWITTLFLTSWIMSLTWLAYVFHNELQRLDSSFKGVAASSQGVPDALQKFHTISKNLQQNQTVILGKIADLKLQMENLSRQVADMQSKLNKFQEKLGNAPEYVNIPQQISEVSGSLANLGSQIKDLTTTVTSLKDYKTKSESLTNVMQKNITDLRQSLFSVQNMSQVPVAVNNKSDAKIENILKITDVMKSNISSMNSTFSNKIQWIYEDQQKDRKTVDLLSEIGQNISARVTTLEGICNTCSSVEISMKANINDISKQLVSLTSKVQEISTQIPTLQSKYRQLSSNNTDLQNKVRNLIEISGSGNPSPVMATPPDASTTSEKDRLVTSPPPKLATAKTEWQSTSS